MCYTIITKREGDKNMRKKLMGIYRIEYTKINAKEQMCTVVDRVLAKSKEEALRKFDKHHNGQFSDRTIIDWYYANY
jgi:hypothetical protein